MSRTTRRPLKVHFIYILAVLHAQHSRKRAHPQQRDEREHTLRQRCCVRICKHQGPRKTSIQYKIHTPHRALLQPYLPQINAKHTSIPYRYIHMPWRLAPSPSTRHHANITPAMPP
ncbi:unnamed protein product, partial [Ectocarpus sp. 8 AP-2014]